MYEPFQLNGNTLHIEKWEKLLPGLVVGFTTRLQGVSKAPFCSWNMGLHVDDRPADVLENRQRLAKKLQIPLDSFTAGEQIHGTKIKQIGQVDKGRGSKEMESSLAGIDGMFTKDKTILCTAFFADCVPLFFLDPNSGLIGIAHAGWKGTVGRIAEKMVLQLIEAGANRSDLLVVIGPCISKMNYEVDDHVIKNISGKDKEAVSTAIADGRYLLDLKKLNEKILLETGLSKKNIEVTNYCTYDDEELFYSYRRDQGKTGRMLAFIGYRDYI